jgi:hypothetical protein
MTRTFESAKYALPFSLSRENAEKLFWALLLFGNYIEWRKDLEEATTEKWTELLSNDYHKGNPIPLDVFNSVKIEKIEKKYCYGYLFEVEGTQTVKTQRKVVEEIDAGYEGPIKSTKTMTVDEDRDFTTPLLFASNSSFGIAVDSKEFGNLVRVEDIDSKDWADAQELPSNIGFGKIELGVKQAYQGTHHLSVTSSKIVLSKWRITWSYQGKSHVYSFSGTGISRESPTPEIKGSRGIEERNTLNEIQYGEDKWAIPLPSEFASLRRFNSGWHNNNEVVAVDGKIKLGQAVLLQRELKEAVQSNIKIYKFWERSENYGGAIARAAICLGIGVVVLWFAWQLNEGSFVGRVKTALVFIVIALILAIPYFKELVWRMKALAICKARIPELERAIEQEKQRIARAKDAVNKSESDYLQVLIDNRDKWAPFYVPAFRPRRQDIRIPQP